VKRLFFKKEKSPALQARAKLGFLVSLGVGLSLFSGCNDADVALDDMGGAENSDPIDSGPRVAADCSVDDGYEHFSIENFERGATTTAFTNNEVCSECAAFSETSSMGGASSPADERAVECEEACRASQSPSDFEKPLTAELIPDGRCESNYALHLEGGPFYEWGGLVGFPFAPGFDARDYDGISFWGRVRWGTRGSVRVTALDLETDATFVDPETGAPRCAPESSIDEFSEACDPFGRFLTLTGDWKFFRIPFDELRQNGYGRSAPYLDLGLIRQISLEYGQGEYDLWIDDVSFYREAEAE